MSDFSLAEVLRGQLEKQAGNVSEPDTSVGREQIEYISLDRIDTDPNNFYGLSGLEELAANIELLGLQQPLRVRSNPEAPDRVIIVSGHRRYAAIKRLAEDGGADFPDIACIRERAEGSAALQELRLIYANSDTRTLTSAELAKQAERVEMLLYQLKEEGMDFPGRMRDHVAEACKISAPKLARLKVIQKALIPEYKNLFDKNKLPEQAAYALARLPENFQKRLGSVLSDVPNGNIAEKVLRKYNEGWRWEPELQCPDGKRCKRGDTFLRRDCEAPGWASWCGGKTCCLKCKQAKVECYPCNRMCSKAKAQRKSKKDEAEEAAYKRRQKEGRKYQKETQVYAKRLLPAIGAAGLPEDTKIPWRQWRRNPCISQIRQWAAGEFDDPAEWHEAELAPEKCDGALKVAQLLGCSADFLMGLTDDFRPPAALEPPAQNVSNLDTSPEDELEEESWAEFCAEEPPVRHVRWENREKRTPPENRLILTYNFGKKGPMFRAAIWNGTQLRTQDDGAPMTSTDYTHWLEIPGIASGESLQLAPPEGAYGQMVISGWMPGGTFPFEPCEVVAYFRVAGETASPDARIRRVCWFDGKDFLFKRYGSKIDAECVCWMALPPVEDDVFELDTSGEEQA